MTGQKITDIKSDGTYDGHRVYMGDTVINDNTFQGPYAGSPDAYTAIGFKVTDPVSGSTQEMNSDGAVPSPSPYPHARNELVGLGTSIPAVAPTPYAPNYLGRGGHAGDAGSGCAWDGTPMKCELISDATIGMHNTYEVNVRAPGGWDLLHSLESQITSVRYDTYLHRHRTLATGVKITGMDDSLETGVEMIEKQRVLIGSEIVETASTAMAKYLWRRPGAAVEVI